MLRLAVATAAVTLGLTGVAAASPPLHEQLPPFEFSDTIDCGTFDDDFTDFFSGVQTTYFDASGAATRIIVHVEHHSTDVNSVSGVTIHEHGHFTVKVDLATGMQTVTGNQEVANRPGHGVVVQDVGRAVFDADGNLVFFAGGRNHSELLVGDQVLCDALA